jgi:site-specific recombinase XerD
MGGYRSSTQRSYNSAWQYWGNFIRQRQIPLESLKDALSAENVFLEFLESMIKTKDMSTSTFLIVRSAVSSLFRIVFSKPFGENYQAQLMARSMRNQKPRKLKHHQVFDIALLIDHYRASPTNEDLSDQDLQAKVATMLIVYIQLRPHDMLRLDMGELQETETGLFFGSMIKNAPEFSECILSFVQEKKVCPVRAFLTLWQRVCQKKRDTNTLFWNEDYSEPLSKVQLERLMKRLMGDAGVPQQYTPYSIKHAAITHLLANNVQEWMVNKNARLSQFTNTAARHYFIGQANLIVSKTISDAGRKGVEIPLSPPAIGLTPHAKEEEEESEKEEETQCEGDGEKEAEIQEEQQEQIQNDSDQLAQIWLDNLPTNLPTETFTKQDCEGKELQIIPSETYDELGGDFSLFSCVCSVLSSFTVGTAGKTHSPSGRRGGRRKGRGQLTECTCSSHVAHRSHSPDRPPTSPNSGSLSQ